LIIEPLMHFYLIMVIANISFQRKKIVFIMLTWTSLQTGRQYKW